MIPAGWQQHPTSPGYMWNPATNEVTQIPTAAAPPPAVPPGAETYGSLDVGAAEAEHTALSNRSKFDKTPFLDWPEDSGRSGDETTLIVRFLPPWQGRLAWAKTARFRLPSSLVPDAPEGKRIVNVDSWDVEGGPGNDPIAAALEKLMNSGDATAQKTAKSFKARPRIYWQCLHLQDPRKHFVQQMSPSGSPMLDAAGQPIWICIPSVIAMGPQLHRDILKYIKAKGDPTHPDHGYSMKLTRNRTGGGDMDVEYSAMDLDKGPIDPSMRSCLAHLHDLSKLVRFREAAEMHAIAQNILAAHMPREQAYSAPQGGYAPPAPPPPPSFGGPSLPAGWVPHPTAPGYAWQQATNKVVPVTELQNMAPPPPPPPPPPAPPAPPGPPAPPAPPAVGGYTGPLPPAVAPGYPSPPVGPPMPAPGMPHGVMSPGQLEQHLHQNPGAPPAPPGYALPPPPPPPPAPVPGAYPPPVPPGWDPSTGTPF